ncbi:MAG: undecaprenyl-diphosphate phosphatase [Ruminococcus sp.]|nr:undecaprenyl-diphosphate phosphatase [Ruminococcus sp.]
MSEVIKAIIIGIIEGITEWLPISSTAHIMLVEEFLQLKESQDFKEMFDVVIQLGAIIAVVIIFWKKLWPFGKEGNKHPLNKSPFGQMVKTDIFIMWFKVLVACIPAAVIGLALDDWIDAHLRSFTIIAIALIVFGIAFLVVEDWNKKRTPKIKTMSELTYKAAFIIGVFQLIAALFPGTSRSGATIIGALLIGVARPVAAEFTFFLAIPTMFGASLLKLVKFGFHFSGSELAVLLTGMIVSFVVSVLVIKLLMDYIKKHDFKAFGWYRIVLGVIVLLYVLLIKK